MKFLKIVIGTLCVLIIAAFGVALSGIYNVSATVPHLTSTTQFLTLVRDRSIARHSRGIALPSFDTPGLAEAGVIHFNETCRKCHGAPGQPMEEFAEGLYPAAPSLRRIFNRLDRAEVFWVISNGLKMTGMPAFDVNHKPEEIAAMVAFLGKLPELDAQGYREFVEKAEKSGETHHPDASSGQPSPSEAPGHAGTDAQHPQ